MIFGDIFWQPKLTNVLRELDDKIITNMELEFSKIMGFEVKCSIIKFDEEHWQVSYNGFSKEKSRKASIKFIMDFFDRCTCTRDYSTRFDLDKPIIKICDIMIHPEGQGLGSEIIEHFLQEINKTQFEQIILKAQDEFAGKFWGKFGFVYKNKTSPTMPSMYLNLYPRKEKKIDINWKSYN